MYLEYATLGWNVADGVPTDVHHQVNGTAALAPVVVVLAYDWVIVVSVVYGVVGGVRRELCATGRCHQGEVPLLVG